MIATAHSAPRAHLLRRGLGQHNVRKAEAAGLGRLALHADVDVGVLARADLHDGEARHEGARRALAHVRSAGGNARAHSVRKRLAIQARR